jgi:hypothetical protein
VKGAGHNDVEQHCPEFLLRVQEFLEYVDMKGNEDKDFFHCQVPLTIKTDEKDVF